MAAKTSHVCTLSAAQAAQLRDLMEPKGWQFDQAPYARWRARLGKTTVVAYESGKLTVQGKGTPDFVQFILEPEILGEARFGYEHLLAEQESPEMFTPHAGIDESGKGDYFGPLVIAAAYVDGPLAKKLLEAGVADSKTIKSARRMATLDEAIRKLLGGRFSVVAIGPQAYNRLYGNFDNLNRLLAWGHARALENLLEKVPDCPRAISDQFGRKETVRRALQQRGRSIRLEQRTKAESDVAVAAASILARAEFVRRLETLGKAVDATLPKGAGPRVLEAARELVKTRGAEILNGIAKLHFKTTARVLA
jgi:ribonuclease HIII